jgi:protein phosphatase
MIQAANFRIFRQNEDRVAAHEREVGPLGEQDKMLLKMGTTVVVACLCDDGLLAVAHVGDSRLYRCRRGQLTQLTEDHRQPGGPANILIRAVGTHRVVIVDTAIVDVEAGDALLLCSDGLHELCSSHYLSAVLSVQDPGCAVASLIEAALNQGGTDNIGVTVVRLDGLPNRSTRPPSRGDAP